MAGGLAELPFAGAVDWNAPWLAPWRELGPRVALQVQGGNAVHGALQQAQAWATDSALVVRFCDHAALPLRTAYEAFIHRHRSVPTRDNLHDFFNGLVWLRFPRAKQRLNELQAQAIAADGVRPVRGPLRDALTVFDENGALLQAPPALWDALRARDWQRLFVQQRPLWRDARLTLFGHALLEKLVSPRKPMVAHVHPAPPAMNSVAKLDAWLANAMQPEPWSRKPFVPLPVLGVPGWWPANDAPGFYDDAEVFRPPRNPRGNFPSSLV